MRYFILIAILLLVPGYALAQITGNDLTIDLAEKSVNITTGFTGASLSLFGVKEQTGDIAIVIQGPERRMVVRRKDQVADECAVLVRTQVALGSHCVFPHLS